MAECEELSDFDKGQVVVARRLGMSVSETAVFVGCSRAAAAAVDRQWRRDGLRLRAGTTRLGNSPLWTDEGDSETEEVDGAVSELVPPPPGSAAAAALLRRREEGRRLQISRDLTEERGSEEEKDGAVSEGLTSPGKDEPVEGE